MNGQVLSVPVPDRPRWVWVDYAKGIGIVLVVYGHVLRGLNEASLGPGERFFRWSDGLVYGFHMPLFFVLSGLFAVRWTEKGGVGDRLWNKARSILWPYLLWSLIQGGLNIAMSTYTNGHLSPAGLVTSILYRPYGQFWFLYVLFIYFAAFLAVYRRVGIRAVVGVAVAAYIIHPYVGSYWPLQPILKHFLFFAIGAILPNAPLQAILDRIRPRALVLLAGLYTCASFLSLRYEITSALMVLAEALAGIALSVAVSGYLERQLYGKWLAHLGTMSMPIYLMHVLAVSGTRILLVHVAGVTQWGVHVVLGLVAGVLLPLMAHRVARRLRLDVALFGR